jgi:outer membrane protein OmpA-like peptidoglycan-associated protein
MKVTYRRDKLDLDAHTLEFQLSRPAGSAELQVFAEDGSQIGEGSAKFAREAAGTWLKITWTAKSKADVFRLELRAVADDGIATRVKLLPWTIYVQHEEVRFPTGSADIPPAETPKLDASYQKLIEAVDRARKADPKLPVRVFIAGHTDTVGSAEDNRKLSLARAKSIAAWFRDRGLPLPLSYAGFGEDALKVKTGDNVDEPRNRRADYILGVEEPQIARGVASTWHPL